MGTESKPQWLTFKLPEQNEIALPVTILEHFLTDVIILVNLRGETEVFQFTDCFTPATTFDPIRVRRVELLQRYYAGGHFEAVEALAFKAGFPTSFSDVDLSDPVLANFGVYSLLHAHFYIDSKALTDAFPTWSDMHVIVAEDGIGSSRDEAIDSYRKALDLGLPTLGLWLDRLYRGVELYLPDRPPSFRLAPPGLSQSHIHPRLDRLDARAVVTGKPLS